MIRAHSVLPAGTWERSRLRGAVTLDFDRRCRRRIALTAEGGAEFMLDLAEATRLRAGDGIVLTDGSVVEVIAAPEPLLELRSGSVAGLTRLAWHIGNRHIPAEIASDSILIREDHVLADMARRLGATVSQVTRPFEPEGGAYDGDRPPSTDHAQVHDDAEHTHHGHPHAGHHHHGH